MADLVSMRAEAAEARQKIDTILGIDGELSSEQSEELSNLDTELRSIDTKIKQAEIRASAKEAMDTPSFGFKGVETVKVNEPKLDARQQFVKNLNIAVRNGGLQERFLDFASTETGNTNNAAALFPVDLQNEMVRMMGDLSAVRQACQVRSYATDVEIPLVSAVANVTAYQGEGEPAEELDPDFSKARIRSFSSRVRTRITQEVLQDSRGGAVAEVVRQQAEAQTRWFESRMMTNTAAQSSSDVDGLLATNFSALPSSPADHIAGNSSTSGSTTCDAVTYEDLVDTAFGMKAAYWSLPKNWILSPSMYTACMKILDTNGRPILQPALTSDAKQSPAFGTLLGYPVFVSDAMTEATEAGTYQALLLESGSYIVADRLNMISQVDPYGDNAANGMVSYYLSMRSDARWLRPESSGRLLLAAT